MRAPLTCWHAGFALRRKNRSTVPVGLGRGRTKVAGKSVSMSGGNGCAEQRGPTYWMADENGQLDVTLEDNAREPPPSTCARTVKVKISQSANSRRSRKGRIVDSLRFNEGRQAYSAPGGASRGP